MNTRIIVALLLSFTFTGSAALAKDQFPIESDTLRYWITQGNKEYSQQKYLDALNTFRLAQRFFPEKQHIISAQLFEMIGCCNHNLGNYGLAEDAFKTAHHKFKQLGLVGQQGCVDTKSELKGLRRLLTKQRKDSLICLRPQIDADTATAVDTAKISAVQGLTQSVDKWQPDY